MKLFLPLALIVAGPAMALPPIQPGLWRTTSRVVSAEIPGAPPAMLEAMKKRPTSNSYCLSAKDAEANPQSLFGKTEGKCRYTKFRMSGGRLAIAMACGTSTITSIGRYTPTSYHLRASMVAPSSRGATRFTSDVTGERIGACKP